MGKLLGRPKTTTSAQLKLMIPIAIVSAFLNNTPVVVVMIPIVQRWAKNIGVSSQQLLIPLSFASILGGTCTLIGTSTNLVVLGLLQKRYPGGDMAKMGLFELGKFGLPVALAGITFVIASSIFLIPGTPNFIGRSNLDTEVPADFDDSILLGARLTKWSAAVNRTVRRSGLRDTGGVYLVSVHRAATGNVHRAVGQDFVLNAGDVLYFTGLVEGFGEFCEAHGLEMITNEVEDSVVAANEDSRVRAGDHGASSLQIDEGCADSSDTHLGSITEESHESYNLELGGARLSIIPEVDVDIGETRKSLAMSEAAERMRYINRIQDVIRGIEVPEEQGIMSKRNRLIRDVNAPPKIVAHADIDDSSTKLVVVAIDATDRPGLLLDVSKTLIRLGLNFHRTEAVVIDGRSLSLWRCEVMENGVSDIEEIWSVMNAMLEIESGVEAIKSRGLRVIRAVIPNSSTLIGTNASETNFRLKYKAAIVAVQRDGKSVSNKLSQARFAAGDTVVLQASDDSPLLIPPPKDFYRKLTKEGKRPSSLSRLRTRISSFGNLSEAGSVKSEISDEESAKTSKTGTRIVDQESTSMSLANNEEKADIDVEDASDEGSSQKIETACETERIHNLEEVWKDLSVLFQRHSGDGSSGNDEAVALREFLTAMEILPRSKLASKKVAQLGLDKLPGLFLVSIERPTNRGGNVFSLSASSLDADGSLNENDLNTAPNITPVSPEEPLQAGDILWFSGTATSIGDLRKIPGMKSYVNEEVKKINEKVHDRRLVQAVIARRSKLLGKTVKEIRFRTNYGAAVIAVHREGKRIQEHPGNIKLHAGDVLLLEAGPTFIRQNAEKDTAFSLLSEVEDSAPPRLKLLVPALLITVAMLAVYTAERASLLVCALVASMLMVIFGILSQQEVRDAINWEVYLTIAAAFGIGTALTKSGVASGVADGLVKLGGALGLGNAGLYATVYLATFLISNVVTNNAAAALLFPIAMDAAETTNADARLMAYILMLGASASFMSPFGYTVSNFSI